MWGIRPGISQGMQHVVCIFIMTQAVDPEHLTISHVMLQVNLLIIVHEILWKISELSDYLQVKHIIKQALHMHCGFFKGYFLQE